jgi:hypothetical protein
VQGTLIQGSIIEEIVACSLTIPAVSDITLRVLQTRPLKEEVLYEGAFNKIDQIFGVVDLYGCPGRHCWWIVLIEKRNSIAMV